MGAATSNLPALAALGVFIFNFTIAASFWFNNRCNSGWAYAGFVVFGWLLLLLGFDVRSPFDGLLPGSVDFDETYRIYFVYYAIGAGVACLIAWFISVLMDIREPIALYALIPSFATRNVDNLVSTPCRPIDKAKLRDYYCACNKGLSNGCFHYIEPPYWHAFVGILLMLFTLVIPYVLFYYLLTVSKWAAYFASLAMRVIGYVLAWFYWSYRTDLYVWGPSEYNQRARLEAIRKDPDSTVYAEDPDIEGIAPALYAETQALITKNVLVIGLIDVLSFLLLGGIIVIPSVADVDIVWIAGISLLLFIGFLFALIALIYYARTNTEPLCPRLCPITGRPIGAINSLSKMNSKKPVSLSSPVKKYPLSPQTNSPFHAVGNIRMSSLFDKL